MSSIRLHPKHGLNPTLTVCFFCGKETGEIALLGAAYRGEAPRHMVVNKVPCDWCKGNMKRGIVLVEATGKTEADCRPTGSYVVLKEEVARRMFIEPMLTQVLRTRIAFVDPATWAATGLREACAKNQEETDGKL